MIIYQMWKYFQNEGITATYDKIIFSTTHRLFMKKRRFFIKKYQLFEYLNIKVIKSYYGVKFLGNYGDITFKFCVTGSYGDTLYRYLRKFPYKYFFIDIGANQGLYSLVSAKTPNCVGCVAFEPVSKSFKLLENNIELNKLKSKIKAYKKAIGSSNSTEIIKLVSGHSGAASMDIHVSNIHTGTELIDIVNHQILNEILEIPESTIIIVKIDTEGFEEIVIDELMKTKFWRDVFSLFVEVNESWINSQRLYKKLKKEKFAEVSRIGSTNHYDVLMEKHYSMH